MQIIVIVEVEGQGQASWSGSGSIITPDGLILTNAHVVLSDKYYKVQDLIVALTTDPDLPPDPRYYAEILQADTALDIAVIRITTDLGRNPVNRNTLDLPTVRLGDSDALRLGEPLFILGYPGIGGETITLTTGEVGGFTAEAGVGPRAFIKTSATITGGNSGGMAANANGELVGIPTQLGYGGNDQFVDCRVLTDTNRDGIVDEKDNCIPTGGFINALRPVNLAFPSIEAAKRGEVNIASITGKGVPMPTPGQLLYENDFSYPKGHWSPYSDNDVSFSYLDGRYHLEMKTERLTAWSNAGENFSDAVISVDAQVVSATGEGEFGLICRYQNMDNYYVFDVSENGFFSIWKHENGEFVWIRKWEASSAIPTDNRSFKLTVACIGNKLSMAIDGQVLGEAVDASFSAGDIGLFVATQNTGGLRVAFDNLVVHEPAVTAPPPSREIVFSDDFSDPGSGWSNYTGDDFATTYSNGVYRIYIQPEYYSIPVHVGSLFKDVQIEVDVTRRTGLVDGEFGLICRRQMTGLHYDFIVRGSGLAVIGKMTETEYKWLASTDLGIRIAEISGPIRLRADCVGSDLVMYVNGVEVLRAQDSAYDEGYSGLIAGTYDSPDLEILFDNFVVYRP
ncbi:MAG: hypothetical protein C0393_07805 [Anaerolinea sp.]|nr:hypothetical protein [Anaerolinea sp.]